jgi:hypothetical protein
MRRELEAGHNCRRRFDESSACRVGIANNVSHEGRERSALVRVADRFDVVPVRTNDECRVVVRVVVRAQTRRTIVLATRLQSRAMEGFDLLATLGLERQVKMRRPLLVWYRHSDTVPFGWLSSTPFGGHSVTTVTPSGSSALRKNALLAA